MQHQFYARRDTVFTGIFLTIAGLLLLVSKLIPGSLPGWLVSWPMAVIGTGLLIAVISKRKTILWIIPIFWGGFAMLEQQMPELNIQKYSGAVSIIFVGLLFLGMRYIPAFYINKDRKRGNILNITTVFTHNQSTFNVNNYNGSRLICVLGNMEIKMENDFDQDDAIIDASITMGVLKLTVPPNWIVKNSMASLLGAITDYRKPAAANTGTTKTITLAGNVSMGAIEIV